jgi:hypothetical protein
MWDQEVVAYYTTGQVSVVTAHGYLRNAMRYRSANQLGPGCIQKTVPMYKSSETCRVLNTGPLAKSSYILQTETRRVFFYFHPKELLIRVCKVNHESLVCSFSIRKKHSISWNTRNPATLMLNYTKTSAHYRDVTVPPSTSLLLCLKSIITTTYNTTI